MGVQTYYNNYRWGAAAEEDLPKEEENIVLPAKTSLRPTSSSSINGCSWLYHVDEGKTAYAGSEFTIRGFPSVAGMVQPAPIPVTKLFVVPAHLAQCSHPLQGTWRIQARSRPGKTPATRKSREGGSEGGLGDTP